MVESDFAESSDKSAGVITKRKAVVDARRQESITSRQLIDEDAVTLSQEHQQLVDPQLTRVEPGGAARLHYCDLKQHL